MINYVGYDELKKLENLINYNKNIVKLFSKYVEKDFKVLDFGAGIGTLSVLFNEQNSIKPICLEPDLGQSAILTERGFKVLHNLSEIDDNSLNLCFSSNVFEHIENDNETFKTLYMKIKPGGYICIYVPAFNFLWSDLDVKVHHYRRYDKKLIYKLIKGTNCKVIDFKYIDPIGFFLALLFKLLNKKTNEIKASDIKIFDKFLFPSNKIFEKLIFYAFGKNILLTIQKK